MQVPSTRPLYIILSILYTIIYLYCYKLYDVVLNLDLCDWTDFTQNYNIMFKDCKQALSKRVFEDFLSLSLSLRDSRIHHSKPPPSPAVPAAILKFKAAVRPKSKPDGREFTDQEVWLIRKAYHVHSVCSLKPMWSRMCHRATAGFSLPAQRIDIPRLREHQCRATTCFQTFLAYVRNCKKLYDRKWQRWQETVTK